MSDKVRQTHYYYNGFCCRCFSSKTLNCSVELAWTIAFGSVFHSGMERCTNVCELYCSILAITTHRMPNVLTSVRHTKRHLNYLKLYSHCPENAADSADVFTLSNITPHPEIFPFKPRGVFSLALQGAVLLHRIPFSYWQSTQLKLGCINSRLHWTPCCNLQFFEIHWQCTGILGKI